MAAESLLSPPTISDQLKLRDRDMTLRLATRSDESFLAFLDAQERLSAYAGLGVSKTLLEKLSATHLRAQTEGYLAQYRSAENLMVLRHGEPIGRFWVAIEEMPRAEAFALSISCCARRCAARGLVAISCAVSSIPLERCDWHA